MKIEQQLWYTKPASEWFDALPIGTGRLAAMIFGGTNLDRVALNHEWFWTANHRDRTTEKRSQYLPEIRQLLADGKYKEASIFANDKLSPYGRESMSKGGIDSYQPIGDLFIELNHNSYYDYKRELDMVQGIVSVSYNAMGNGLIRKEYIAHLKEDLIFIRITSEKQAINGRVWLDRIYDPGCEVKWQCDTQKLTMSGHKCNNNFCTNVKIVSCDGETVIVDNNKLAFTSVKELVLALNIGTSAKGGSAEEEAQIETLQDDWQQLLAEHQLEYDANVGSMSLELDLEPVDLPTNERIKRIREGHKDPGLALLYFNYGRYLLSACSANGELPANLQGKWNEDLQPAWNSDYHMNINLQMNYWCAETGGLQASTNALFTYLESFMETGQKAAKDLFDCRGLFIPMGSDPWGIATIEGYGYSIWVSVAAWCAQHFWWHYEYSQDQTFLSKRAYPFIKQVAVFYQDFLVKDTNGVYQITPSQSPENSFKEAGDIAVASCISSAMDIQLVQDCLCHAIKASELLDVDCESRNIWQDILDNLEPMKIDSLGRLMEWNQEFTEREPGHRHISHLFGLYPGEQIGPDRTPELYDGAIKSLQYRLDNLGGHTGWSRAWMACCFARLGKGNDSLHHIEDLIAEFSTDSMLDLHPPRIFQIDGNIGGTAAVLEMLIQSYHEELHLLPALPESWKDGSAKGLRARGGLTIDLTWKNATFTSAEIISVKDGVCKLKDAGIDYQVTNDTGQAVELKKEQHCITFYIKKGRRYTVR